METKNTTRLKELMASRNLGLREVADLTGRSYKTVRRWRSIGEKPIPDSMLELLDLKTRGRAA